MGLSFRKSIKVGPMRFNFSKSGIGVSAGFKGFRVGSGPRGNYVSISALGVRFRHSLDHREQVYGNRCWLVPVCPCSKEIRLKERMVY